MAACTDSMCAHAQKTHIHTHVANITHQIRFRPVKPPFPTAAADRDCKLCLFDFPLNSEVPSGPCRAVELPSGKQVCTPCLCACVRPCNDAPSTMCMRVTVCALLIKPLNTHTGV